jgi:hypothetical protein
MFLCKDIVYEKGMIMFGAAVRRRAAAVALSLASLAVLAAEAGQPVADAVGPVNVATVSSPATCRSIPVPPYYRCTGGGVPVPQ